MRGWGSVAVDAGQLSLPSESTTVEASAQQRDPLRLVRSAVVVIEVTWIVLLGAVLYELWGLLGW
jgi:hypothetical protein